MVIIYKVLARFKTLQGHSYTDVGYFLTMQQAIHKAHEWWSKKGTLSTADKVIVQELSIGPQVAGIRMIDWITD